MTTIKVRFEAVDGDFDFATGKLKCVGSKKYAEVSLCFVSDNGWFVPFAKIKLHSSSLWNDAVATFDDAVALGEELCTRWNGDDQKKPQTDWHEKWQEAVFDKLQAEERLKGFSQSIHDALGPRLKQGQRPAAAIEKILEELKDARAGRDAHLEALVIRWQDGYAAAQAEAKRQKEIADGLWKRMVLDDCWNCGEKLDGHRDPDGCCASCGASGELEGAFESMKADLMRLEQEAQFWRSRAEKKSARRQDLAAKALIDYCVPRMMKSGQEWDFDEMARIATEAANGQ